MFLFKLVIKLLKYENINKYAIKFEKNKQLSYKSIYSLGLIEVKTLKTIFIQFFKFLVSVYILFN